MAGRNNRRRPSTPHNRTPQNRAARTPGTGAEARRPPAPPASPWRAALNRFSAPLLVRMHALPRWLVPIGLGLLMALGFFLSGSWAWLGTVAMALVTVFIGWLFALSWPVLTITGRMARGIVTLGLVGITYLKATGQL